MWPLWECSIHSVAHHSWEQEWRILRQSQVLTPSDFISQTQHCNQNTDSLVSQFGAIQRFILTWVENIINFFPTTVWTMCLQAACCIILEVVKFFYWIVLRFSVWMISFTCFFLSVMNLFSNASLDIHLITMMITYLNILNPFFFFCFV